MSAKLSPWDEEELQRAVNTIMAHAQRAGYSIPELADRADLSPSTVYRIWSFDTVLPQWRTINRLAGAVGLRQIFVASGKRRVA